MTAMKPLGQQAARGHRGFTIIELMGVLALISILVVIAIPLYQRYTIRTQVAEGIGLIKPLRYAIYEYYTQLGSWPPDNATAGVNPPADYATRYVESLTISQNATQANITIKYKIPALGDDDTLIFYTTLDNGHIRWHCDFGTLDDRFRPSACRSE